MLLAVAALTSAISLLKVALSHAIDWRAVSRWRAATGIGAAIFGLGIAVFVARRMGAQAREHAFRAVSRFARQS